MENGEHLHQVKLDHDLLVRIDERTKTLQTDFVAFKNSLNTLHSDQETRIRALEKSKWTWTGISASIATGASWLVNYLLR
jgi:SMC interacting uncharacterized protein involved in chromosome segregation